MKKKVKQHQMKNESDYIPLNPSTINSGQYFGIFEYSIPLSSHMHHLEYIEKGNSSCIFKFESDFLFSFEMFPLPRVLAKLGGFKRVNEIISIHGARIINKLPRVQEKLFSDVKVDKIFTKGGIVFGYFTSTTKSESGIILMESKDKAILLNQTDKKKYRDIIEKRENSIPILKGTDSLKLINKIQLFFRHKWDDSIWHNNIHTDSYAMSLGYEKGLIEAPCFVDILLANQNIGMLLKNGISFSWNYNAPLYHGILTNIFLENRVNESIVYVCNAVDNSIIMTLNIKNHEK